MIKRSIHQEDIIIVNTYAFQINLNIKHILSGLKGEIDNTITVFQFPNFNNGQTMQMERKHLPGTIF